MEDVEDVLIEQLVDQTVYRRRVQIRMELPTGIHFPIFSNLGIRRASGPVFPISMAIDRPEQLCCNPKSLVFRGREATRRFSVERMDGQEIGDLDISFDNHVLTMTETERTSHRVEFEVVVRQWPPESLQKYQITCSTVDGLTTGTRVIIISPNQGVPK